MLRMTHPHPSLSHWERVQVEGKGVREKALITK